MDQFQKYLEGISGGNKSSSTASTIVKDVSLYFDYVPQSSNTTHTDQKKLFNRKCLKEFYHHMKNELNYKPSTLAEKLRRLRKAVDFVAHENFTDAKIHQTSLQYKTLLTSWINSLSKPIALQRQKRGIKLNSEVAHTTSPNLFLMDKEVKRKVSMATEKIRAGGFDTTDVKLLTAYAAALLVYKNSQRSGVVDNLTMEEFELKRENHHDKDKTVITCVHHKTGAAGGAKLVVKKCDLAYLLDYRYLVRQQIAPASGCGHLFFLTNDGQQYKQVYRKILHAIKVNNIHIDIPPPPSAHRVKMTTKSLKTNSDIVRRKINKHLSHSNYTTEKYYEFTNDDDAILAYTEINKLAGDMS